MVDRNVHSFTQIMIFLEVLFGVSINDATLITPTAKVSLFASQIVEKFDRPLAITGDDHDAALLAPRRPLRLAICKLRDR